MRTAKNGVVTDGGAWIAVVAMAVGLMAVGVVLGALAWAFVGAAVKGVCFMLFVGFVFWIGTQVGARPAESDDRGEGRDRG